MPNSVRFAQTMTENIPQDFQDFLLRMAQLSKSISDSNSFISTALALHSQLCEFCMPKFQPIFRLSTIVRFFTYGAQSGPRFLLPVRETRQ